MVGLTQQPDGVMQYFNYAGNYSYATSTAPTHLNSISVRLKRGTVGSPTLTDYVGIAKFCGISSYDRSTNVSNIVFSDIPTDTFQVFKFNFDPAGACQLNDDTLHFAVVDSTTADLSGGGHTDNLKNLFMSGTTSGLRGGYLWSAIGNSSFWAGYALWFEINATSDPNLELSTDTACPNTDFTIFSVDYGQGLCQVARAIFVPPDSSLSQFSTLWDEIKLKPPLGYFTTASDAFSGLNASSTPEVALDNMDWLGDFKVYLDGAIATLVGITFLLFLWHRFRKFEPH